MLTVSLWTFAGDVSIGSSKNMYEINIISHKINSVQICSKACTAD